MDWFEKSEPAEIAGDGLEDSGCERFMKDVEIGCIDFVLNGVSVGDTSIEL